MLKTGRRENKIYSNERAKKKEERMQERKLKLENIMRFLMIVIKVSMSSLASL